MPHLAPGLCPEYNSLDPNSRLENARLGLDRAEQGLGVPKVGVVTWCVTSCHVVCDVMSRGL